MELVLRRLCGGKSGNLSSLIQTLLSAQESHLFGAIGVCGLYRRYGISPILKDFEFQKKLSSRNTAMRHSGRNPV